MTAGSGRLRRSDRLRSSKDFRRLSREGDRRSSRHFVALLAPALEAAPEDTPRLGITVSRKVGNAVTRNRVKRGIREWFRCHRDALAAQQDVVVIARRGAGELTGAEVRRELRELFA